MLKKKLAALILILVESQSHVEEGAYFLPWFLNETKLFKSYS